MLALKSISGLTIVFSILFIVCRLEREEYKRVKISVFIAISFTLSVLLYFGTMCTQLYCKVKTPLNDTKDFRLSTLYDVQSDKYNMFAPSILDSSIGSYESREISDTVTQYAHSKSDVINHGNDMVSVKVTNENADWFKYLLNGGDENLYTVSASIKDISKTYKFTGIITEETYASESVNKVGELYLSCNGGNIDKKFIGKKVEVEVAYSDLFSKNNIIYSYDIISAREVK